MTELEELQSLADELSVEGALEFTPFAANEAAGIYGFKVNGDTYSNALIAESVKEEMILLRNGFNYGRGYAELDIEDGHRITVRTVSGEIDYPSIDVCVDGDLDKPLLGIESHGSEGIIKTYFYSDKDNISHTFAQDVTPLLKEKEKKKISENREKPGLSDQAVLKAAVSLAEDALYAYFGPDAGDELERKVTDRIEEMIRNGETEGKDPFDISTYRTAVNETVDEYIPESPCLKRLNAMVKKTIEDTGNSVKLFVDTENDTLRKYSIVFSNYYTSGYVDAYAAEELIKTYYFSSTGKKLEL